MSPQLHSQALNLYAQFYEVRRKLSETTASYWTDLEIYSWLNQAQLYIARKSKCLKKTITVTTTTSTQEYDLNDNSFADIMDLSEDGVYFKIGGTSYSPLTYKTKKQLSMDIPGWQGTAAGTPTYYYYNKTSKTIGLYSKPNSTNAGAYLFVNGYYKPKILNAGTAASGNVAYITLATGSSTVPYPNTTDDYYNGLWVEIYGGTGAGQKVEITDYVASTRVCSATFTTAPDSTSVYGMVPEIPEEAHFLMVLYAVARAWEKTGTRTNLANNYWQQFNANLNLFIGETIEEDDEQLLKDSYR